MTQPPKPFLAALEELMERATSRSIDAHFNLEKLLLDNAPAIAEVVRAAQLLHDNLAEYQRINNIGGYDNQDMRMMRDALAALNEAKP